MGDHEPRHVGSAGRESPCRSRTHDLEAWRRHSGLGVTDRHLGREVSGERLAKGRIVHAERDKDMMIDVVFEAFPGRALDHIAGKCSRVIGVSRRRAGDKNALRHPGLEKRAERSIMCGIVVQEVLHHFFEPCRVGHDLAQGDGRAVTRRDTEIEVSVDVAIEIELVLLHQLHHCGPGNQLRNRTRPEQGAVWVDYRALCRIGIAKSAGRHDVPILDDHDHSPGNIAGVQRIGHIAVQPGIDVGFAQDLRSRRSDVNGWRDGWLGLRILPGQCSAADQVQRTQ